MDVNITLLLSTNFVGSCFMVLMVVTLDKYPGICADSGTPEVFEANDDKSLKKLSTANVLTAL